MVTATDQFFNNTIQLHHDQAYALHKQIEKLKLTNYPTNNDLHFITEWIYVKFLDTKRLSFLHNNHSWSVPHPN
ncbi:hypothetical protein SAMN04487944_1272 [Gracilibacillus ureilyticus]|uniref:Uncharacterized protein n=1 Tax=Gracilibacillus ureilyticus TaxID=531814 RepID=A0A1H9VSD6_9BACI|nr:hypothetical protein SAMN04487944_1272 [Gracilibacillus ureilyticus]